MSIEDRKIKNIDVRVKDASGSVRNINLVEHDLIDLKFKDTETNKIIHIETGEIIKIGIADNKTYLVVFSYNYNLENNLFHIPTSSLTQIITVNHSPYQYTLTPIYSSDESVAVLRSNDGCLEYTVNGKDWVRCAGGASGITIDDVDREIEKYLVDYPSSEEVLQIVDQATQDFVTSSQVESIVDDKVQEATSDLPTIEDVDEKIAEATRDFVTSETVDEKIEEATANFVTSSDVTQIVDQATQDFVTSSQVESIVDDKIGPAIEEAVKDFVTGDQVDEKISEATADFVTEEAVDTKIEEATADFITEAQATQIVDQATRDFVTESQVNSIVDTKIEEATVDFVTGEQVDTKISEATADFITGAEVDTKISEATANFTTFDDVNQILEDYPTEDDMDTAIEDALVDYAPIENPTFIGEVKVPTQDQSVNNDIAASTSYVRTAVSDLKSQLAGALHFKGVVDTFDDLPTENEEGDVWQTRTSEFGQDLEFVWTLNAGTGEGKWVELGTFIDLSAYPTRNEMVSAIETAEGNANAYTDEKIASIDPYLLAKEKGYIGTVDEFYEALAEVLNNSTAIVINEVVR